MTNIYSIAINIISDIAYPDVIALNNTIQNGKICNDHCFSNCSYAFQVATINMIPLATPSINPEASCGLGSWRNAKYIPHADNAIKVREKTNFNIDKNIKSPIPKVGLAPTE